jgi:uncharacterized glyoxalase superfamily protein PhnB
VILLAIDIDCVMPTFDRLIPLLAYEDIPAAHDFLVSAFGFTSGGVMRAPDGQAVHGEVQVGTASIWLHRVTGEHGLASAAAGNMKGGGLVVWVDDVDAHFAHARAAGAQILSEPVSQPYGQREYGARDIEGHLWWFATPTR